MFKHVAPYQYLLPTMYLFMADIANPYLFVCGCRTWICLGITGFYEEQRQPSSGVAGPTCPEIGKLSPQCWEREVSTQFARQFVTAVTALPLVGCVVWSREIIVFKLIVDASDNAHCFSHMLIMHTHCNLLHQHVSCCNSLTWFYTHYNFLCTFKQIDSVLV